MIRKLTRGEDGIALVIDPAMLKALGLDENAEVEVSTDGEVIVLTQARGLAGDRVFRETAESESPVRGAVQASQRMTP
jgi:antitoxin component of MazEF toxin-antitoxin module